MSSRTTLYLRSNDRRDGRGLEVYVAASGGSNVYFLGDRVRLQDLFLSEFGIGVCGCRVGCLVVVVVLFVFDNLSGGSGSRCLTVEDLV